MVFPLAFDLFAAVIRLAALGVVKLVRPLIDANDSVEGGEWRVFAFTSKGFAELLVWAFRVNKLPLSPARLKDPPTANGRAVANAQSVAVRGVILAFGVFDALLGPVRVRDALVLGWLAAAANAVLRVRGLNRYELAALRNELAFFGKELVRHRLLGGALDGFFEPFLNLADPLCEVIQHPAEDLEAPDVLI